MPSARDGIPPSRLPARGLHGPDGCTLPSCDCHAYDGPADTGSVLVPPYPPPAVAPPDHVLVAADLPRFVHEIRAGAGVVCRLRVSTEGRATLYAEVSR